MKAWIIVYLLVVAASISAQIHADRKIFQKLYDATNGPNWKEAVDFTKSLCGVSGVGCNSERRITRISLPNFNLTGTLPPELGGLTALKELFLSDNNLSGSLASELGNLQNLEKLFISKNLLTGIIPTELGNLENLKSLHLFQNMLTGSLPQNLFNLPFLSVARLSNNFLTGSLPLNFSNSLKFLFLNGNSLSGLIPDSIFTPPNLSSLRINGNNLIGAIPTTIGNLALQEFLFHSNGISGSIPIQIGNAINLQKLWGDFNNLTGSIPTQIGLLSKLMDLRLSNNNLEGGIPNELFNINSLQKLFLQFNQFSGTIPSGALINNLLNLQTLDLQGNLLSGNIPGNLLRMFQLFGSNGTLNLSGNCFAPPPTFNSLSPLNLNDFFGNIVSSDCKLSSDSSFLLNSLTLPNLIVYYEFNILNNSNILDDSAKGDNQLQALYPTLDFIPGFFAQSGNPYNSAITTLVTPDFILRTTNPVTLKNTWTIEIIFQIPSLSQIGSGPVVRFCNSLDCTDNIIDLIFSSDGAVILEHRGLMVFDAPNLLIEGRINYLAITVKNLLHLFRIYFNQELLPNLTTPFIEPIYGTFYMFLAKETQITIDEISIFGGPFTVISFASRMLTLNWCPEGTCEIDEKCTPTATGPVCT